jgi:MOSC domain-containing protein YiiM
MSSSSTTTSNPAGRTLQGLILQISISPGGIPKRAIASGNLEFRGFEGDYWAHPQIHGGPNQAVLLIASEALDALRAKGFPVYPGALGENLTTEGMDPAAWRSGQQYRAGEAVIELTKVRTPCSTLDVYGPSIRREIGGLGGFYAKVIREGPIFPGNSIVLLSELA